MQADRKHLVYLLGTDDAGQALLPGCAELARAAEREFSSFYQATVQEYGSVEARICAKYWLEEFQSSPLVGDSLTFACRAVTLCVLSRLARNRWRDVQLSLQNEDLTQSIVS